jgi:hypothetical protein
MKRLVLIFGIFLAVFTACQEEGITPPMDKNPTAIKSAAAKEVLNIAATLQGLDKLGFGSPSLFTKGVGFSSSNNGSGRKLTTARKLTKARIKGDSTDTGDGDDDGEWEEDHDGECGWTTCATETFTENADGSFTWVIDYGVDGCEENGYFMKGKMVEIYTEVGITFTSTVEYVDFGDNYYLMNGTSSYSGIWEETKIESNDPEMDSMLFDYDFSGSFAYIENLTVMIKDTLEDGALSEETIAIEAQGSETYNKDGSTANEGFSKYTLSNGDFYNTTIDTPLFYSFACEYSETKDKYVFIEVSGVESTSWKQGTELGEFSVNYGDGTCDNIITITENGESYDVDLSEEWETYWSDDKDGTKG